MPVSPRTQEAYLACVRQWAEHFNAAPEVITAEQLRQYFIHLKCIKKVARQTSTQALCAIKLFWEKSLRRPYAGCCRVRMLQVRMLQGRQDVAGSHLDF